MPVAGGKYEAVEGEALHPDSSSTISRSSPVQYQCRPQYNIKVVPSTMSGPDPFQYSLNIWIHLFFLGLDPQKKLGPKEITKLFEQLPS